MKPGDIILVRVYPDKIEERVVVQVETTYVVVCRPEVYQSVAGTPGVPNASMGFPIEDVLEVRGPFALANRSQ